MYLRASIEVVDAHMEMPGGSDGSKAVAPSISSAIFILKFVWEYTDNLKLKT